MTKTIKWTLQLVNEPNLLKESNTGFILISQKFPDNLCKIFAMLFKLLYFRLVQLGFKLSDWNRHHNSWCVVSKLRPARLQLDENPPWTGIPINTPTVDAFWLSQCPHVEQSTSTLNLDLTTPCGPSHSCCLIVRVFIQLNRCILMSSAQLFGKFL